MAKPSIGAVWTAALFSSTAVLAQQRPAQNAENTEVLNTVIVTGSRIVHSDTETPNPVQVISAADLQQSGYTNTQEVLKNLTANGQGTLSQSFSGAFAAGAAGIALRGLNVGYTLVLIDGHRSAPYPIGDDGQRSFVDVADIPFDSIERIEVLKDGASAVYGSDAIAGVVNIILKKTFTGASVTADAGTSAHADGTTEHAAATWGFGDLANDGHNFYIAGEFRHQQQIRFLDRGGIFENKDYTATGGYNLNFGAPNPINGGLARSATGYVINEDTGAIAGFMPGCNATAYAASQCTFPDTWNQIQPGTKNYNIVSKFTQSFAENWKLSLSGTYFQSQSVQVGAPSRAFNLGYQGVTSGPGVVPQVLPALGPTTIPSTNPSFPTGTGLTEGFLQYTFLDIGPTEVHTNAKTYRAVADLDGKVGAWNLDGAVGYTEVTLHVDDLHFVQPVLLQNALNSTTAPYLVGQRNTAAVINSIAPPEETNDSSKLFFAHAGATTPITDLPGGPLAIAFGGDWYERKQFALAPAAAANGLIGSPYGSPSNNFTVGTQNVSAAYAEIDAPVLKTLDIDAAIRYDHYNLSGGQASPKIGFKWQPIDEFGIRGTASRGFRAPGPAENGQAGQTFFAGSKADPILCKHPESFTAAGNFAGQCNVSIPGLQGTNPNLKPEVSKSFTFGFVTQPIPDLKATVDIYSVQINNQIIAGGPSVTVRGDNLSPLPKYQADGTTVLVAPPVAPILYFTTSFINANSTKTNGLDLGIDYHHRFDSGWQYSSNATLTYIHAYQLTDGGVTYELAGTHGPSFFSGDTGNPKTRANWANTIGRDNWSLTATVNYTSAFNVTDPTLIAFEGIPAGTCLEALTNEGGAAGNDYAGPLNSGVIPPQTSCNVKHFTTVDLYGSYDVSSQFNLHASVTNLFNTKAPLDWATYGGALGLVPWNPSLHLQGAIGTFFTLGATYKF
ncbi:MAG: TonB-dependent receptor [Proteobacteria bacterium]|nr:TonB-dependent receptor [Pseudomonadota bacterium]